MYSAHFTNHRTSLFIKTTKKKKKKYAADLKFPNFLLQRNNPDQLHHKNFKFLMLYGTVMRFRTRVGKLFSARAALPKYISIIQWAAK